MRAPGFCQGIPKFRLADRLQQAGENSDFFQTSRSIRTPMEVSMTSVVDRNSGSALIACASISPSMPGI